jgi:hypothetical protein
MKEGDLQTAAVTMTIEISTAIAVNLADPDMTEAGVLPREDQTRGILIKIGGPEAEEAEESLMIVFPLTRLSKT